MKRAEITVHPDNLVNGRVYDLSYSGVTGHNVYLTRGIFIRLGVMADNLRAKGAGPRQMRLTVLFRNVEEQFTRCISWWRVIGFTEVDVREGA